MNGLVMVKLGEPATACCLLYILMQLIAKRCVWILVNNRHYRSDMGRVGNYSETASPSDNRSRDPDCVPAFR